MSELHPLARRVAAFRRQATSAKRDDVIRCALFILACLPVFLALRMQQKHWVNIPIWDEWDTPGVALLHLAQHKLSWSDLLFQHNESRKFFPRLIYLALSWPQGWHVRHAMVLTFLCACALSLFALFRLRDGKKNFTAPGLFAWLVINSLLFIPSGYENFLCGYSFEIFIPILALCGCIAINLSDRPLGAKVLWNSALAVIATYSFAHGMILWALGLPIPTDSEKKRAHWLRSWAFGLLAWGVIGAIAIGYYFVGYKRPDIAPPSAGFLQAPFLAQFIIAWLGTVLKSNLVDANLAGGLAALALFTACLLSVFFLRANQHLRKQYYPWFLLAAFSLGSGLLTGIGRVNLGLHAVLYIGVDGFSGYRYHITSVLAYIATAGLLFRLYRDWIGSHPIWRFRFIIAITVLTTLLSVAWLDLFAGQRDRLAAFKDNRRRARTALIWSKAIPRNPDLFLLYPYPEKFPPRIAEMKNAGLINVPEISERVIEAITRAPQPGNSEAGAIESSRFENGDKLRIAGWARSPARNSRADYVVLGWEDEDQSFHPFTALTTIGQPRPDLIKDYQAIALRHDGFAQEINISALPRRTVTIRAWSVDLAREQVFPLQGAVRLERRPMTP